MVISPELIKCNLQAYCRNAQLMCNLLGTISPLKIVSYTPLSDYIYLHQSISYLSAHRTSGQIPEPSHLSVTKKLTDLGNIQDGTKHRNKVIVTGIIWSDNVASSELQPAKI